MYINIRVQWTVHKKTCIILKQYDYYKIQILNGFVHSTLLYTINIMLNETYA